MEVRGRVAALLELGSGFNPEFTGRENVFFNAGVLGQSEERTREKFADRVREITGGGAGYAFEMAGSARALELAYKATARGGTTVTAGLPHPQQQVSLQHVSLVAEERTLKGSYLGSCVPSRDIPRYIEWYRAGRLPVDRLMSERLRLDGINAGFDRLAAGESIRQVIEID